MKFFMRTSYDDVFHDNVLIPSICNESWWFVSISEHGLYRHPDLPRLYDIDEGGRVNILGIDVTWI